MPLRRLRIRWLLVIALVMGGIAFACPGVASAQTTNPSTLACDPNNISGLPATAIAGVQTLDTKLLAPISQVTTGALTSAQFIWKSLAILEISWFLVTTLAFKKSIEEVVQGYAMKLVGVLFVLGLITTIGQSGGQFLYNAIIMPFAQLGQLVGSQVGGTSTGQIAPNSVVTNVLQVGYCASYNISVLPSNIWYAYVQNPAHVLQNPFQALLLGMTNLVMFLPELAIALYVLYVFCMLAAEMLFVIVEAMLVLGAGVVLLGFGASRWTAPIAAGYWRYAVGIAMKIFTLEIVIGIASGLITATMAGTVTAIQNIDPSTLAGPTIEVSALLNICIIVIVINVMAKNVNHIAMAFQGTPDTSLGHQMVGSVVNSAKTAAAVVVGGAVGGAALGAAGATGAAGVAGGRGAGAIASGAAAAPSLGSGSAAGGQAAGGGGGGGGMPMPRAFADMQNMHREYSKVKQFLGGESSGSGPTDRQTKRYSSSVHINTNL
jgi:P-type conjugative transfer protein TrbL